MRVKNQIRLYNTLNREVEDFFPLEEDKVKIYACGPTVYDYTHIGHIRKYVLDDVLVRLLRYLSYDVKHVMNVTDVGHLVSDADTGEDKMEKGARREGKSAWDVARFYEKYFFDTMAQVLVKKPDIIARATEHIPEMIGLIKKLEDKGFTYKIDDGIYYDTSKFPNYTKLAQLDTEGLKAGARVDIVPGKKHPTDFALWKFTPFGVKRDMEWESPWGKGFPGWHIECSAMSMQYLGETLDIHTGGIDHIPVHHTNEIAQSEGATGRQFVRYWMHHNHLFINGEKMSKSSGNFYKLEDIQAHNFSSSALRYLVLQTHYRQESNFTWDGLAGAEIALTSLKNHVSVIKSQIEKPERSHLSEEKLEKVDIMRKKFKDVMRLDLNTPQALAVVWEIVKSNIPPGDKHDLLMIADEILGLGLSDVTPESTQLSNIPEAIAKLLAKRSDLRHQGKFMDADMVRKEIEAQGFTVFDTPEGTTVKKT